MSRPIGRAAFFVPIRCARCWEKLPPGATIDLCPDCQGNFKLAPPPPAFGASGVEGTYLAGLDRFYFAECIRAARKERA